MPKRRNMRRSRGTARRSGFIKAPPVILAVCEGKTEERLLNDLRAFWRIPNALVRWVAQAGVPSTVVKTAKDLRAELGPNETWVVFDRDEHPCWDTARLEAQQARPPLRLAISNPCVEQWAILLHQDQRADLHRREVQRRLAAVHPGYHHDQHPYLKVDVVLENLEHAIARSKVINDYADGLGERYRAPTTYLSDLIERLRELA